MSQSKREYEAQNNASSIPDRISVESQRILDAIRHISQPPRHVYVLLMDGKPLTVYTHRATAEEDMRVLVQGDQHQDQYTSHFSIKEMRLDYTPPTPVATPEPTPAPTTV